METIEKIERRMRSFWREGGIKLKKEMKQVKAERVARTVGRTGGGRR